MPLQAPPASGRSAGLLLGATSRALTRIPMLPVLLGHRVVHVGRLAWRMTRPAPKIDAMLGWGFRPTARRARQEAQRRGVPFLALEDAFLRSYGTGDLYPPLGVVVDAAGIYYDARRPSALEQRLESDVDLLAGRLDAVVHARAAISRHGLSKYNHAPPLACLERGTGSALLRQGDAQRVLVVDQTAGDLSVTIGGAGPETFARMLQTALRENPGATVYVKTHPEVSTGRKSGHFDELRSRGRVVVLRQAVEPLSLIREMHRVYVVSSTLGFEALLAGKPVTCFGMPWYAGWGVTDDRQACARRTRRRSVDELFAAAYLDYARYVDPSTGQRGTVLDAIDWLVRQKQMAERLRGPTWTRRLICVGFRRWKTANLQPILAGALAPTIFVPDAQAAQDLRPGPRDWLVVWGAVAPEGVDALAQASGAKIVRLEDGFVRSVGLGSDLIPPLSIVLDTEGIYFDPSRPSELENLLNSARFEPQELHDAQLAREFIVANGLTKYNLEPRQAPAWAHQGRRIVLVPGQVEDDASIRLGCTAVCTNLGLLQATRAACPQAYIVYKPHPDVTHGNRRGHVSRDAALRWADHVETRISVVSCVDACDEVHTMTSLTGFDALLRGKKVVVHGQPFYAGWGLTQDVIGPQSAVALNRRQRRLSLDELVAGTLLRYPIYWDPRLRGYTTFMAVLRSLMKERDALEHEGLLEHLRGGWWRRQVRKALVLVRAWARL